MYNSLQIKEQGSIIDPANVKTILDVNLYTVTSFTALSSNEFIKDEQS
jgi:hypothetical protein